MSIWGKCITLSPVMIILHQKLMFEANWMETVYVLITRSVDITNVPGNMRPIRSLYMTENSPIEQKDTTNMFHGDVKMFGLWINEKRISQRLTTLYNNKHQNYFKTFKHIIGRFNKKKKNEKKRIDRDTE